MFSLVPSGSKLALIFLAKTMQAWGGSIIDCQLKTAHLESMGGRYISYDEYMKLISS
jgi:leucyl/phenylalanyl-tRNA--protein transferase